MAWPPHCQPLREPALCPAAPGTSSSPAAGVVGDVGIAAVAVGDVGTAAAGTVADVGLVGIVGVGTPRYSPGGSAGEPVAAGSDVAVAGVVVAAAQWFAVVGPCVVESWSSDHPWPPLDKTERSVGMSPPWLWPQY